MGLIASRHSSMPRRPEQHDVQTGRPSTWQSTNGRKYVLRVPSPSDGAQLWNLVRGNRPLELNSPYSYILLTRFFAGTCVVAERNAEPVGFVSAFVCPADADTLFIWQIAVNETERGHGLGRRLLHHLLARPACDRIRFLVATAASSNIASRSLFHSLARDLRVPIAVHAGFAPELFPDGTHEREEQICIGPLWRGAGENEGAKNPYQPE